MPAIRAALCRGLFRFRADARWVRGAALLIATPAADMLVIGLLFVTRRRRRRLVAQTMDQRAVHSGRIVPRSSPPGLSPISPIARGGVLLIFLAGGIESMFARIGRRAPGDDAPPVRDAGTIRSSHQPCQSPELAQRFDAWRGSGPGIAVHCLDLDRFKPVNDRYGHPMGDALLKAVAGRLQSMLRRKRLASRPADEFVVVQPASHAGEADMLARRIARAIAQPYAIDGHEIVIGTSIAMRCRRNTDRSRPAGGAGRRGALRGQAGGGGIAPYRRPCPRRLSV